MLIVKNKNFKLIITKNTLNNNKSFGFIIFIKYIISFKYKYINVSNKDSNLKNKAVIIFYNIFIKYLAI